MPHKGYKHTKEHTKKRIMPLRRRKLSEETKRKISIAKKGKKLSEEHKQKLSLAGLGRKHSEETKKKISLMKKGKPFSGIPFNQTGKHWKQSLESIRKRILSRKGYRHSEETKRKIRKSEKGKKISLEVRRKISEAHKGLHSGKKCNFWKGGISFEPYSVDWTNTLKRSIRERDKYTCYICGKEPAICVHHIDYNKKNCNPKNLVTLCGECHPKTNHNREYWLNYFKEVF